jgi:predicted XRE-type DNA-binding protein
MPSGNVFADLRLPCPAHELRRARLTLEICKIIKVRRWTRAKAATVLGIKEPHVSALMRNRSGVLSAERLMELLMKLR